MKQQHRYVTLGLGWFLVVLGACLVFLPASGLPFLFSGLALLGREATWARRLHSKVASKLIRSESRQRLARVVVPTQPSSSAPVEPDASPAALLRRGHHEVATLLPENQIVPKALGEPCRPESSQYTR